MKAKPLKTSSTGLIFSTSFFLCLGLFVLVFSSCSSQKRLGKTTWRKSQIASAPSLILPAPGVGARSADEEENDDKPSSSLALASDSYSGPGLAIALSGDDLISKSLVK